MLNVTLLSYPPQNALPVLLGGLFHPEIKNPAMILAGLHPDLLDPSARINSFLPMIEQAGLLTSLAFRLPSHH